MAGFFGIGKSKRRSKGLFYSGLNGLALNCNQPKYKARFKNMPCLMVLENPQITFANYSNCNVLVDYIDDEYFCHQNISLNVDASGILLLPAKLYKIWNIRVLNASNQIICTFPIAENMGQTLYATNGETATANGFIWHTQSFYNGLNELGFSKAEDGTQVVFNNGNPPNLPALGLVLAKNAPAFNGWNSCSAMLDFNSFDDGELGAELNLDPRFETPELWTFSADNLFSIANGKLNFAGSAADEISTAYIPGKYPAGLTRLSFKIKNLDPQNPAKIAIGWTGYKSFADGLHTVELRNSVDITIRFIKAFQSGAFELENLSMKHVFVTPQTHPKPLQIFNKLAFTGNPHGYPEIFKPSITETPYFETSNPYLWHFEEFDESYLQTHLNPAYAYKIKLNLMAEGLKSLRVI